MSPYKNCRLCPRRCGVNREAGQRGFCGETSALRLAFAGIHRGEEPPITGAGGSGTIFVTGCNLGCAFCQNYQISGGAAGRAVSMEEFAEICLALQKRGAENINIVTGSHAAPALAAGISEARKRGLGIPVLWNSSGYDGMESLEIMKDFVDVYLPDLKTLDSSFAGKFFKASEHSAEAVGRGSPPDYTEYAARAILKMMEYRNLTFSQVKPLGKDKAPVMLSGVMIRHLVVPGYLENTRQVLKWFSENCAGKALLSLMTQYTPVKPENLNRDEIPDSYLSETEYKSVLSMLDEFGIDDGYCQELVTGSDWLPDFTRQNPFSSELSMPVWHYQLFS